MPICYLARVLAALIALSLSALVAAGFSPAQALKARQTTEAQFQDWLRQTVWPDAQRQGVSRETFNRATATLALDWTLPELQPPGQTTAPDEQRQAEFQSPGRYFAQEHLSDLAKTGSSLLTQWATALAGIEQRYGVPRDIIVAIWGRESHFGRVAPRHQALRVLATQAFMGRRRAFYYPELLAILVIQEQESRSMVNLGVCHVSEIAIRDLNAHDASSCSTRATQKATPVGMAPSLKS